MAGYVYNPFGIRVRADTTTTINQGTPVAKKKAFVIDAHNGTGYAQVLEEKDGSGALTMSYTIGDDVIAQSGPSVTHHFGYDGHGSTRLLTGSASTITDRYDYDAYGVTVRGPSSTLDPPSSSLLYTGEQFDVDLQQYYLRARYYDQSRGRFTQSDPFAGTNFDPQSLHKYCYTQSDPVNNIDPTGAFTLADMLVTVVNIARLVVRRWPLVKIGLAIRDAYTAFNIISKFVTGQHVEPSEWAELVLITTTIFLGGKIARTILRALIGRLLGISSEVIRSYSRLKGFVKSGGPLVDDFINVVEKPGLYVVDDAGDLVLGRFRAVKDGVSGTFTKPVIELYQGGVNSARTLLHEYIHAVQWAYKGGKHVGFDEWQTYIAANRGKLETVARFVGDVFFNF